MLETGKDKAVHVWRVHPQSADIRPADITLDGQAPASALRYCGPFLHANAAGFYVYSPIDMDVAYYPDRDEPWDYTLHTPYSDDEVPVLFSALQDDQLKEVLEAKANFLNRRPKLEFSPRYGEPGPDVLQIWTGCIFQTPPGWGLWIRSPINREYEVPYRVDEGILETDWMHIDIWMNLKFYRHGEVARLRRDGPPVAHLVPVSKEAYEDWSVQTHTVSEGSPEAQDVMAIWLDYQMKKYTSRPDGQKESTTYNRERKRHR